jgi:hypothetical protein
MEEVGHLYEVSAVFERLGDANRAKRGVTKFFRRELEFENIVPAPEDGGFFTSYEEALEYADCRKTQLERLGMDDRITSEEIRSEKEGYMVHLKYKKFIASRPEFFIDGRTLRVKFLGLNRGFEKVKKVLSDSGGIVHFDIR